MSYLSDLKTNLETRIATIGAELAALAVDKAGGKPNARGGDGVNVDHQGYKAGLYKELKEARSNLIEIERAIAVDGGDVGIVESEEYV